ncbi:MAG: ABC transporter permease subunit [Acidihalobacter sp.]|uniref:molybdate ABC transporter permease subunit n=1 Tax=Acidihalobacter sp. TaxID=1872108 RepID=UPI00307D71FB
MDPLTLSTAVALVVAPLFLLLGVPLGYLLSRPRLPLRGLWEALVSLPLVFPPIVLGFLLLLVLGRDSLLGTWLAKLGGFSFVFSFAGVALASLLAGLPLIVKPVQAALESSQQELIEASYTLGKSPLATFFRVVLPGIRASVLAGLGLAVARSLGEVGITLMLGGDITNRTETLSLAVYNAVLNGDFGRAERLSLVLGAASLLLFIALRGGRILR